MDGDSVSRLLEGEVEKLIHMEERLRQRVVGQDEALTVVSDAVRRARAGCKIQIDRLVLLSSWGRRGLGKRSLPGRWPSFF